VTRHAHGHTPGGVDIAPHMQHRATCSTGKTKKFHSRLNPICVLLRMFRTTGPRRRGRKSGRTNTMTSRKRRLACIGIAVAAAGTFTTLATTAASATSNTARAGINVPADSTEAAAPVLQTITVVGVPAAPTTVRAVSGSTPTAIGSLRVTFAL